MDFAGIAAIFSSWVKDFGYFGVFASSLVSSASVIFPLPGFIFILGAAPFLNPIIVGIAAGAGSAIGETTGYLLGKGGKKAVTGKDYKWLKRGEKWFSEGKGFFVILLFAATPLPDDVIGIVAGIFDYDVKKFIIASFIGKTILNIALAFLGIYGAGVFGNLLSG